MGRNRWGRTRTLAFSVRTLIECYSKEFFFFNCMASPVAYGSSQARGQIGAVAEAYATATTADPSCGCNLHQILDPLSEVRDGACNLMDASQVLNH